MADRNIVTQVGIEDLKFALSEVAENLRHHVNASLSRAHGLNVVAGFVDADGNDLTSYQDSNGDIIANLFLRFVIGGVFYFAPAKASTLDGQPPFTGIVNTSAEETFQAQGGSAWITDYTSDQVAQAQAMNNDVLIPHTRQPHASTHGSLTVLLQSTFTNLGHTVGTHVIQIRILNNVYNIPAATRLGGPLQPPRIGGIDSNISVSFGEGEPNTCDKPITVPFLGGTKPVAYHFQYNNGGIWTDLTPSTAGSITPPGWEEHINYNWPDTEHATLRIIEAKPGSRKTASAQFRCRVTNAAIPNLGPVPANANSGVITNVCTFTASDATGGICFITTAVCLATGLGDDCESLQVLRKFRDTYMQHTPEGQALLAEYDVLGPKIVAAILATHDPIAECALLYLESIQPAAQLILNGDEERALACYTRMVRRLQERFAIK